MNLGFVLIACDQDGDDHVDNGVDLLLLTSDALHLCCDERDERC